MKNVNKVLMIGSLVLTACGQVPAGIKIGTNVSKPNTVSPSNVTIPSGSGTTPTAVSLTYYTLSSTRAPQAGFPSKTYTSTGHCVQYLLDTYCWDDGKKTLTWVDPITGSTFGPFYYSYFNMSKDTVGWSHANGGMQADLMPQPTLIDTALANNMAVGAVNTVLTTGTPTSVSCTDTNGILNCVDFSIDLTQVPL